MIRHADEDINNVGRLIKLSNHLRLRDSHYRGNVNHVRFLRKLLEQASQKDSR